MHSMRDECRNKKSLDRFFKTNSKKAGVAFVCAANFMAKNGRWSPEGWH
jgi:hypothetical protein